jgi:hypothetical protein
MIDKSKVRESKKAQNSEKLFESFLEFSRVIKLRLIKSL